jgi:3' exoribonuclease, RNase T-like
MKFFLDTEFIERGRNYPVTLVSIGIVAEDGREFYAISSEFDPNTASQWVKDNVLSTLGSEKRQTVDEIVSGVIEFIWPDVGREEPAFFGYYCDYDWVVFCQMFGTMMDLPRGFPMYCRDLKQMCDEQGNPKLPKQGKGEHNALNDAKWNKLAYEFLAPNRKCGFLSKE